MLQHRELIVQGIETGSRMIRDGRLAEGDLIVKINGFSLSGVPFSKAQRIFKEFLTEKELTLVVEKSTERSHLFPSPQGGSPAVCSVMSV